MHTPTPYNYLNLQHKKVLILGCGESGVAMANWCNQQKAYVHIADTREHPPYHIHLDMACTFHHGINTELLDDIQADFILLSPGLSPYQSPIKEIYQHPVYKNQNKIHGELWLFNIALQQLQAQNNYQPEIIAITGTNGKTTTTQLTAHLCRYAGKQTVVAGNISPSLLSSLSLHIQQNTLPEVWVLELSSFQLYHLYDFTPHAATILNISEDHLDWHSDILDYIKSKFNIAANQSQNTCLILNRQDKALIDYANKYKYNYITFGIDVPKPQNTHDFGLNKQADGYWLYYKKNLLPANALKIRGLHNTQNALAALGLCKAIGLNIDDVLGGLRSYNGEPHRVQLLDIINGIEIYDDSKGTNVGATLAAMKGLEKSLVWVAGGDAKGQLFDDLIPALKEYVTSAHLIGKDKHNIATVCEKAGVAYNLYDDLNTATLYACKVAKNGQAILLSPACSSLDMFKNYMQRAEVFAQAVNVFKDAV